MSHIVVNLSLPESRKISLEGFFKDCNYYIQYNKDKDSGRKRRAEEVLGRTVKVVDRYASYAICYRCGRPGHLRFNYNSKMARSSTVCSLCKAHIGGDDHNARSCCNDSARVFPKGARSDRSSKKKAGAKAASLLLIVANLLPLLLLLLLPQRLIILPLLLLNLLLTILMERL